MAENKMAANYDHKIADHKIADKKCNVSIFRENTLTCFTKFVKFLSWSSAVQHLQISY